MNPDEMTDEEIARHNRSIGRAGTLVATVGILGILGATYLAHIHENGFYETNQRIMESIDCELGKASNSPWHALYQ